MMKLMIRQRMGNMYIRLMAMVVMISGVCQLGRMDTALAGEQPGTDPVTSQAEAAVPYDPNTLDPLLKKIDMQLYEKCKAEARAFLQEFMEKSPAGKWGVYSEVHRRASPSYLTHAHGGHNIDLNRGHPAMETGNLLTAYQVLGDKVYLDAVIKTAEFYLKIQQPWGNFPSGDYAPGTIARIGFGKDDTPMTARVQYGSWPRRVWYVACTEVEDWMDVPLPKTP